MSGKIICYYYFAHKETLKRYSTGIFFFFSKKKARENPRHTMQNFKNVSLNKAENKFPKIEKSLHFLGRLVSIVIFPN